MLTMKQHEMPYRLRDLLPAFEIDTGRKDTKLARQVEGLAEFLHKQPRTVRSYLAYSGERMISADDYWATAIEWVRRKARAAVSSTGEPSFLILDHNGDQLAEAVWLWQAAFLADVDHEAADIRVRHRGEWQMRQMDEAAKRRSRLRRVVRNEILSTETICSIMEFDDWCLVDYQMEGVEWRSTPDDMKLQTLERMEAEVIGVAA